ncbi:hypothetical protein CesoFtcFv8_024736 [Champsocephalus esox]|uniref:Uncharacterized protein n=1 Tax=Champsocephalus esox TaxID=159716 RepID=A0AAN8B740_9TELE|nr:hypothetical protein CesoFtcFv8_024736 [Champsocephalus esox]
MEREPDGDKMEMEKHLLIDGRKEEPGGEERQQLGVEEEQQIVKESGDRDATLAEEVGGVGGTAEKEGREKDWSGEGENMAGKDRSPLGTGRPTRSNERRERGPNTKTESPGTSKWRGRWMSKARRGK